MKRTVPRRTGFDHGVERGQELAHAGNPRELARFAASDQSLMESGNGGVASRSGEMIFRSLACACALDRFGASNRSGSGRAGTATVCSVLGNRLIGPSGNQTIRLNRVALRLYRTGQAKTYERGRLATCALRGLAHTSQARSVPFIVPCQNPAIVHKTVPCIRWYVLL